MNKNKLALLGATLILSNSVSSVEVYDGNYDKEGEVSFIVKQGEVTNKVSELFSRLYPQTRVVFKQEITGYLPADIEVSGSDKSEIALEVLAGLGLSACHYENNVVEIAKFKKRGICPSVKMKSARYPKISRLGDGVLSFTNEWFGKFDPVKYDPINSMAINATFIETAPDGNFLQGEQLPFAVPNEPQPIIQKPVSNEPEMVSFEFTSGQLLPQMVELVSKLENSPTLEWKLDSNIQWTNTKKIVMPTYDEILAKILDSYDAFADIYDNDVVVIRRAEGME